MSVQLYDYLFVRTESPCLPLGQFRVVWMTARDPDIVVVDVPTYTDIEQKTKLKIVHKRPLVVAKRALEKSLECGYVTKLESAAAVDELRKKEPVLDQIFTPKEEHRKAILLDFNTEAMRTIIFSSGWEKEMKRLSEKYGDCPNTIKRLVLKYLYTARNIEEAIKDKRRPRGLSRAIRAKLGRKSDMFKAGRTTNEGVNREEHEELILKYLLSRGKNVSKRSIRELLDDFYANFAVKFSPSQDGSHPQKETIPANQRVSMGQFRGIVKAFDESAYILRALSARKGRVKTDVRIGGARDMTSWAAHTYIIDSTVADVYLVSSYDRSKVIGRPVIYLVIDARTSFLLAVYVTLWGPSFSEARNAIYLALSDKKAYLRYLQLDEFQEYFRTGPRPLNLLADRGELLSKGGSDLAKKLQYCSSITAAYQPVWKSLVERSFKRLNEMVIHRLPGMVPRGHERGDADYRLEAACTLWEFRRLITMEQIIWNTSKAMGKWLSPQMIVAGVEANPLAMWDWSLENENGAPGWIDRDQLLTTILDNEIVSVSTEGFQTGDKLVWTADWMKDHDSVKLSKIKRCEAALIQSPEDPALAYCRMTNEINFREVFLRGAPKSDYPITKEDVEDLIAEKRFADQVSALNATALKDTLKSYEAQLIATAKSETAASVKASFSSKASRTADMHQARAAETEYERTGELPRLNSTSETTAKESGAETNPSTKEVLESEQAVKSKANRLVADVMEEW